jgi:hypothetical protein
MDKDDIIMVIREISENAHNLEIALDRAKQIFQLNDCPEPHDHWDDMAELAGFAAADMISGDMGQNITDIIEQLDLLAAGAPE